MAGKPEPVHVRDVNIAGANGVSLFKYPSTFVGQSRGNASDDFIVRHGAPRDAALARFVGRNVIDGRIEYDARNGQWF